MTAAIDICGVLVQARPERLAEVGDRLAAIPGVEVHAQDPQGRLVVIVEPSDGRRTIDTVSGLGEVEGVVATSLVYQYLEDDEIEQESAS